MRETGIPEMIGGKMEWVTLTDHAFLRHRKIYLTGEVNEENARRIQIQIEYLAEKEKGKMITLYINSPGGEVDEGMLLYDMIKNCGCPVRTIACGRAYSMGGFLLSAGTKGLRYAMPHTRIMLHQPSAGTQGRISDMEVNLENMIRIKKELTAILSENTGKSLREVELATEKDFWMSPEEAVEFGLIDGVWKGEEKYGT